MSAAIVMSWMDSGCPYRRRSFDFCRAFWERWLPDMPIVIGTAEPYSRAAGINAGIRACDADVVFQPDPDTLLHPEDVRESITLARHSPGIVNPYNRYLYLTRDASEKIIEGADLAVFGPMQTYAWGPFGSGLAAVYSRETWELAGGFDERFGVWAGDDGAFAYAAHWLVAPGRRLPGDAWHLWHPRHPDSIVGSAGYRTQFAMLAEYRDATSADDVRAIIARRAA